LTFETKDIIFHFESKGEVLKTRRDYIKEILLEEKRVEVSELSSRLEVSEVTVRKYLSDLEDEGFLLRKYGGAVLAENPGHVISYLKKLQINSGEKKAIAKMAASMVKEGENILVDTGSTTLTLVRELRERKLRVVTNSLAIADELSSAENVILEIVGGSLRRASGAMIGPRTRKELQENIRVDKLFLGCSGFDPKRGFSSENAVEAETKNTMLTCAGTKILLADHTKFARPAFANFASLKDIDILITDRKPDDFIVELLKLNGVELKIAEIKNI
jgi:DeoR/GlpR family transcriptional regulator of sugar metabolism